MTHEINGRCRCGRSTVSLTLPKPANRYSPRRCDCDFCVERGVQYLSDPYGQLRIISDEPFSIDQQGSMQAEFLICTGCDDLLAVIHRTDEGVRGAANATLFSGQPFNDAVTVSPRLLEPDQKSARWQQLWCRADLTPQLS